MSPAVLALVRGSLRSGTCVGSGYVDFDPYVLAVSPLGAGRMPNGIQAAVTAQPGEPATIGRGCLRVGPCQIIPGPIWDPRPAAGIALQAQPGFEPDPFALAGRGEGLTPAGDDLLIGYIAGLVIFNGAHERACLMAEIAAARTTRLSATLLRHAALGELPEAAHSFLETGDPASLLSFGHSSGRHIMLGLALAGTRTSRPRRPDRTVRISVEKVAGESQFSIGISR